MFRAIPTCGPRAGRPLSPAKEARSEWPGHWPVRSSHTSRTHPCSVNLSQLGVLFLRLWNQHWASWPPGTPWLARNILRRAPLLASR